MPAFDQLQTAVMLALLLGGFAAMALKGYSQALIMPLLAAGFLTMEGGGALETLKSSFAGFAPIAIVFTAIAICAHQIQRSGLFSLIGSQLGMSIGEAGLRAPRLRTPLLCGSVLALTWAAAATLHNITSIMVMTPIAIAICARYRLPSTWLLCGMLVASNLGGFSTRWGDTPNLIEAGVWGLSDADFLREILPLNLVILAGLTAVVSGLTLRKGMDRSLSAAHVAYASQTFGEYARDTRLDWRLLTVGCAGLASFIVIQFLWRDLEIMAAAAVILMTVALDRHEDRLSSLQALGIDTYMTLLSVFMIAHGLSQSLLGGQLQGLIASTHGAPWAVAISSYLGTGLTEAASWAAAAAPAVHRVNPSHTAAWALGGGICAGSGSLLTAASAGIILWTESRRFPGHQVTFKTYLPFGIGFSLLMLVVYIAVLTALNAAGIVA